MAQIVKKCDCDKINCNSFNKNFHVHVGNYCIHKDGSHHKYEN
jgi:hypothetical protein